MKLICIMGPTASGKSDLAVQIAKHFDTEIISVDARQFYREMNIGTAKPSDQLLSEVKHYFINHLSIQEKYDAGTFEKEALEILEEIFNHNEVAVAVGGSTLYYKALLEGIDPFPPVSKEAREKAQKIYAEKGLKGLQDAVRHYDAAYYAVTDIQNPVRLIRALEVSFSAGKPYSSFLNFSKRKRPFEAIKIANDLPREELYRRIDLRCEEMLNEGLLEEVKELFPYRNLTPLQTVGYREFFDYIENKITYEEGVNLFKQHTRNYAKRQLTWLRKEENLKWFKPEQMESIISYLENRMVID